MLGSIAALMLFAATPAASPENEKQAAALFDKARAALKAGRLADACPTFERSQALDPALGTLLNLAACYEKLNKTGSAYAKYLESMAWAQRINDGDREAYARKASDALKPKVSWLALSASEDLDVKIDALTVRVTPNVMILPIDAGLHALSAEKPGYEKWSTNIEVTTPGATITQRVPQLKPPTPVAAAIVPPAPPPPPAPAPATDAKIDLVPWAPPPATLTPPPVVAVSAAVTPATSSTRGAGVALLVGGGLVTIAGAVGLGWSVSTYNALQSQRVNVLPPATYGVTPDDFERLKWVYPASWVAVGVGATSVIVGAVLAAKKSKVAVAPTVGPSGGAVTVSGQF